MFDVGFSELMVIAVVALVVIGPERLPKVARTAGALLGRAKRYVNEVKADIQSEVDLEEINRIKATFYDAAESLKDSVGQVGGELEAARESLNESIVADAPGKAEEAAEALPAVAQMDFWPGVSGADEVNLESQSL